MKKLLFFSLLFFSVLTLNAQARSELQVGLVSPTGDFGDDDEDDAIYDGSGGSGGAATGFHVGYKYLSPINENGLFWTLNANFFYNGLNSDWKDDLEEAYEDYDDYSLPKYINIPVLVGLQYERPVADNIAVFGEAGVGLNLLKLTNWSASADDYEFTTTFKSSFGLAYKIGAGIVLRDKYTIGLSYNGLGSHKVKYEWEGEYDGDSESEDGKFKKALSVSTFNISLGVRF